MKQFLTPSQLEQLAVPTAEMKQHQAQLKHALLSSAHQPTLASRLVKGPVKFMTKKSLTLAGATVAVAIVALTATTFIAPQTSTASAQDTVKSSLQAVSKLSPSERSKGVVTVDSEAKLREAEALGAAGDLKLLTYDQVAAKYPMAVGGSAGPLPDGKPSPDLHSLKFLVYTNQHGETTILGLDKNKLPVFSTIMLGEDQNTSNQSLGSQSSQTQDAPAKPNTATAVGSGSPSAGVAPR